MTKAEENLFDCEPEGLEGINAFYAAELLPKLRTLEARRKKTRGTAKEGFARILVPVWLLSIIVLVVWGSYLLLVPLVLLTGFAVYYAHREMTGLKRRHKELVVGGLAGFLGFYFKEKGLPNLVPYYQRLGLLPEPTEIHCEDGIVGLSNGVEFQMTEIRFQGQPDWISGKKTKGPIHTKLVTLRVAHPFANKITLVSGRSGDLWRTVAAMPGTPASIGVGPAFRNAFHIFADGAIGEAAPLPAESLDRLIALSEGYADVRACLQDRAMHIAFRSGSGFDAVTADSDFTDKDRIYDTLAEFHAIKSLVDSLGLGEMT